MTSHQPWSQQISQERQKPTSTSNELALALVARRHSTWSRRGNIAAATTSCSPSRWPAPAGTRDPGTRKPR